MHCPHFSKVYIVNRLSGGQRDTILKYDFSEIKPGAPKKFSASSITRFKSLSVRPNGNKGLLLSDGALFMISLDHNGKNRQLIMYKCDVHDNDMIYFPYIIFSVFVSSDIVTLTVVI